MRFGSLPIIFNDHDQIDSFIPIGGRGLEGTTDHGPTDHGPRTTDHGPRSILDSSPGGLNKKEISKNLDCRLRSVDYKLFHFKLHLSIDGSPLTGYPFQ